MHDPRGVGDRQTIGDLAGDLDHASGLQSLQLERAVERLPRHQFHHDVGPAVEFPDVVDRDDVRVVEQGRQPGLALQALRRGAVGGQFVGDELDGNGTVQARVARLIHLSHAAGPERTDDLIHADTLARLQAHLGMAQDTPIARRVLERDGHVPPGVCAYLIGVLMDLRFLHG